MLKAMAKVLAPALLLVAGAAVVPAAQAAAGTPRTFVSCVDHAVGHDVRTELAYHACGAITFEHCYRILRDEWVPATTAFRACKLREQ